MTSTKTFILLINLILLITIQQACTMEQPVVTEVKRTLKVVNLSYSEIKVGLVEDINAITMHNLLSLTSLLFDIENEQVSIAIANSFYVIEPKGITTLKIFVMRGSNALSFQDQNNQKVTPVAQLTKESRRPQC